MSGDAEDDESAKSRGFTAGGPAWVRLDAAAAASATKVTGMTEATAKTTAAEPIERVKSRNAREETSDSKRPVKGPRVEESGSTRARSTSASAIVIDPQASVAEPAAEWVERSALKPWARNPRHNEAAVEQVVASIKRFGFGNPILARRFDHEVIAGHTRLLAAEVLGLDRVPVRFMDLDEADAHLLALADNKLAETATWDDLGVAALLEEYETQDADLAGFDAEERERLQRIVDRIDPLEGDDDEDIELPAEPVSVPGEVYELGPHRLVCGDSTNADVWVSLLGDERVDLVWTDPPYGVSYEGGVTRDPRRAPRGESGHQTIKNDVMTVDELTDFLRGPLELTFAHCKPGAAWYVAAPAGPPSLAFARVLSELEVWRQTLVWVKHCFVFGRSDYHYRHECIYYGWRSDGSHHAVPDRKQDSVWEFDRNSHSHKSGEVEHPTMKPVPLIQRAIVNSSELGATVLDPFAGSGSTMIAAAKEGRRARLIELDPKYCDVIRKRWGHFARSANADAGSGAL